MIPDPPAALQEGVGTTQEFRSCGLEFLGYFKTISGLKDDESVLDVGCGPGRMAIPMAQEFPGLRYEGFDVSRKSIDWCRAEISKPHPSFNFTWIDARNGWYNPKGEVEPDEIRFPYQDAQFDLAILVSVFTHMTPDVVRHYLAELARVVKPGGRIFATAFLMDERARENVSDKRSSIKLVYRVTDDRGVFWTTNLNCPESAVGFHPKELLWMFDQAGFTPTVHRGKWDGGEGLTGHDIVAGVRRA